MVRLKSFVNRYTVIGFTVVLVCAACIIPISIKAQNDRAKHAQVESVGITLIKSELEVYHYSHAAYPTTLAELLKDNQVSQSGGSATTLKVLPYFKNLRYNASGNHQAYTITYTSYSGDAKSISGGKDSATR